MAGTRLRRLEPFGRGYLALRPSRLASSAALVGTAVWFLATMGFDQYISHVKDYGRLYGFVGAVIVLLLWLYLTAYAILFGAQVAAVLEQHRR